MNRTEIGKATELHAEEWFLKRFPALLLAKNYRCKRGEIDLIFLVDLRELVFVEVRARLDGAWQDGIESVGPKKRRRLFAAAEHFLARYRGPATQLRFDILAWDGRDFTHLQNFRLT